MGALWNRADCGWGGGGQLRVFEGLGNVLYGVDFGINFGTYAKEIETPSLPVAEGVPHGPVIIVFRLEIRPLPLVGHIKACDFVETYSNIRSFVSAVIVTTRHLSMNLAQFTTYAFPHPPYITPLLCSRMPGPE